MKITSVEPLESLRLKSFFQGKFHGDGRALPHFAFDSQRAAMHLGKLLGQREAETRAFMGQSKIIPDLFERL